MTNIEFTLHGGADTDLFQSLLALARREARRLLRHPVVWLVPVIVVPAMGADLISASASAGYWYNVIFSTIASPLAIQNVLSSGALAGSQLIAGAFSSFFQTAATTAGAAAVASTTGLPLATAGAAGMAAILSTVSSAAGHGSAGAIIIAGSGLPPRSARGRPGDDITGDKAVRELIAKTKGHYY